VNNGSTFLKIFPSNVGGRINNYPVDTPAIIPSDGKPYEFICIENPLPGEWTFSAPATGQYDSGDIEVSVTALSKDGTNPVAIAYNANNVGTYTNFISSNWGYNGKNKSNLLIFDYLGDYVVAFRPDTAWKGISKIKTSICGFDGRYKIFNLC
jgi:hypothetical protein